jgi:hypothetical protein
MELKNNIENGLLVHWCTGVLVCPPSLNLRRVNWCAGFLVCWFADNSNFIGTFNLVWICVWRTKTIMLSFGLKDDTMQIKLSIFKKF